MTRDEEFVFKIVCPSRVEARKYSASAIPLRVLQIIAWAQDNSMFKKLEIWFTNSASVKDPVLVGYIQNPSSSWQDDMFILARWADELLPVQVLLPDAYKLWWNKEYRDAARERAEAEQKITRLNSMKTEVHVPENFSP
jgi:hypothetical protein